MTVEFTQDDLRVIYGIARYWCERHGHLKPVEDYRSAAHEAALWALRNFDPTKEASRITWLRGIVNYRMRGVLGRSHSTDIMLRFHRADPDPDTITISTARHREWEERMCRRIDLERASGSLTESQKFVYTSLMGGLSQVEIADILGSTETNVSHIRTRLIENIRQYLGESNGNSI